METNKQNPGFNTVGIPLIGAVFKWNAHDGVFFGFQLGKFEAEVMNVDLNTGKALLCFANGNNKGMPLPIFDEWSPWYEYKHMRNNQLFWTFVRLEDRVMTTESSIIVKQEEAPTSPYLCKSIPFKKLRDPFTLPAHYIELERLARFHETMLNFAAAKETFLVARARMAKDLEIDAEEKALSSGKVIFQEDYDKLGKTDKMAWDLKNLKKSRHYAIQFKRDFLFWE